MVDFHSHLKTEDAYFCKEEAVLDKRFIDKTPIEQQKSKVIQLLKTQELVTLHCVQETQLMISILQEIKREPKTTLWHSFNGSAETAAILFKLGVIVSIGPKCTKDIKKIYEANPLFVLETDYTGTDNNEHDIILAEHCKKCAQLLSITVEELEKRCMENGVAFTRSADFGL